MDLHKKLQANHYNTKHPYGVRGSEERTAHLEDQSRLEKEFRADLIEDNGTNVLPEEVECALFSMAWDDGHSSGYSEVAGHYGDLSTLVLLAFNAGINHTNKS